MVSLGQSRSSCSTALLSIEVPFMATMARVPGQHGRRASVREVGADAVHANGVEGGITMVQSVKSTLDVPGL